jgi:methylenetetrahydrofolate dehydrogenase (NADP+)/methenyltetrahydrofolate cyclohydrolase
MGFISPHVHLSADATQADPPGDRWVRRRPLSARPGHPAPTATAPYYDAALATVDPDEDVDGMHPVNVGRLALDLPGPRPCTPAGIEALLAHDGIPVAGREVVILGRGHPLG